MRINSEVSCGLGIRSDQNVPDVTDVAAQGASRPPAPELTQVSS